MSIFDKQEELRKESITKLIEELYELRNSEFNENTVQTRCSCCGNKLSEQQLSDLIERKRKEFNKKKADNIEWIETFLNKYNYGNNK
jgi:redox-regulated HSP33 family molecular chaperone